MKTSCGFSGPHTRSSVSSSPEVNNPGEFPACGFEKTSALQRKPFHPRQINMRVIPDRIATGELCSKSEGTMAMKLTTETPAAQPAPFPPQAPSRTAPYSRFFTRNHAFPFPCCLRWPIRFGHCQHPGTIPKSPIPGPSIGLFYKLSVYSLRPHNPTWSSPGWDISPLGIPLWTSGILPLFSQSGPNLPP